MTPAYRVYVLQNSAGRFYIGLSDDIPTRIAQRNSGQSRWAKGKGPWILAWQSDGLSLTEIGEFA
jgi:predicted GIY-YIG superfamily endonuclease